MDIRRHVAVSTVISVLILIIFRRMQMSAACFLTGILTDLDHIFDCHLNSRKTRGSHRFRGFWDSLWDAYRNHRPFRKVYKFFHSVELMIPASLLYISGLWNDAATGMLIGFAVHLAMDISALGHVGAISLIYRVRSGFPGGSDIVKRRLSRRGRDPGRCENCGVVGEMVLYLNRHSYMGFKWADLNKISILCPECRDHVQRNNIPQR